MRHVAAELLLSGHRPAPLTLDAAALIFQACCERAAIAGRHNMFDVVAAITLLLISRYA